MAVSPVEGYGDGSRYWPIYDIGASDVEFSDDTKLVYESWKDNHKNYTINHKDSNLPSGDFDCGFKGVISTRGE